MHPLKGLVYGNKRVPQLPVQFRKAAETFTAVVSQFSALSWMSPYEPYGEEPRDRWKDRRRAAIPSCRMSLEHEPCWQASKARAEA